MPGPISALARRALLWGLLILVLFGFGSPPALAQANPLPSWNEGPAKSAIVDFVARVTRPGGPDYVAPEERIATFDNDGTLWAEQPLYFQLAFALDRIKALAPQHPEWNDTQPFKSVLKGDSKALEASGEKGLLQIVAATHAGITTDAFANIVDGWIKTAVHPRFKRPYTDLVYQPMLELHKMKPAATKTVLSSSTAKIPQTMTKMPTHPSRCTRICP